MEKKVLLFFVQMIITFVAFGVCAWLINAIFDKTYEVNKQLILQSVLFSIFWSAFTTWSANRKCKRGKKRL